MAIRPNQNGGIDSPTNDAPVNRKSDQEYCRIALQIPIAMAMNDESRTPKNASWLVTQSDRVIFVPTFSRSTNARPQSPWLKLVSHFTYLTCPGLSRPSRSVSR